MRQVVGGVETIALVSAGLMVVAPAEALAVVSSASDRTVEFTTGGLQGLQPARLLDTRGTGRTVDAVAQADGPSPSGTARTLQVAGRAGVPAAGVGAVFMNVTVTEAVGAGFLTVHPAGTARPNASNLNFTARQTVANLVLAKLGTGGRVQLVASATTHVVADVVGWLPEGRDVQTVQPARVLDTRAGGVTIDSLHQRTGPVAPSTTRTLPIAGRAGVPASGAGAVILNLTAVAPTASGFLTAYPSSTPRPNASTLNFTPGEVVPNLVVAKLGADGAVAIYNSQGSTSVIADVVGWIPTNAAFGALSPGRVLDTRSTGQTVDSRHKATGPLEAGGVRQLPVAGRAGVPATGAGTVLVNVTGTAPTAATHLTVFPSGATKPNASNLNLARRGTRANLVVAKLGSDGSISIANAAGSIEVVADVVGWFPSGAPTDTSTSPAGGGSVRMVLPPTTEVVGAGDILALEGTAARPITIVLAPGVDAPPVGGHLVAMPTASLPDGTLARVDAVRPQVDGATSLTVQRAGVPDAFVDLDINFEGPLALEDRNSTAPLASRSRRQEDGVSKYAAERTRDFGFGPVTKAGFTCTGASAPTVTFDASFESSAAEVAFDLTDRYLKVLITTTPALTVGATLDGSVTCTRELSLPGKLPLGPTGLFLSADLGLDVTATGRITGTFQVGTPLTMGFEYRAGAVSNFSGATYFGTAGLTTDETTASLTVTPSVEFDLEFLGAVEIGLVLATPVAGTVTPRSALCATLDVTGRLDAEFELELPWLRDVEQHLGSFDLGGKQVWSGTCAAPSPSPSPSATSSAPPSLQPGKRSVRLQIAGSLPPPASTPAGQRSYEYAVDFTAPPAELVFNSMLVSGGTHRAQFPVEGAAVVRSSRYRSEYHSAEPGSAEGCDETTTGVSTDGSLWNLTVKVGTSDHRNLDQASPGETVLVSVKGYLYGRATQTRDSGCGPGAGESVLDEFPVGAQSPHGKGACPPGTTPFNFDDFNRAGDADPFDCGIPTTVAPDGSVRLTTSGSYRIPQPPDSDYGLSDSYSFDLVIGPRQ